MIRSNKIFSWLVSCAVVAGMVSCSGKLDLEPEDSLSSGGVFSSGSNALSALYGVYSGSQDLNVFGSLPQIVGDFMADNATYEGTLGIREVYYFNALAGNGSISDIWRLHYAVILSANAIIEKVPLVQDAAFSDIDRRMYIAEAKFMRALVYFQLVNLFAQPYQVDQGERPGVPLVLQSFNGTVEYPVRAKVKEVHAQIEKDLLEALPDLAETFNNPALARGRATRGAANALLSRFYLYRGQWDKAAAYAKLVIDDAANYQLAPDYGFYDGNTPEDVFAVQNTENDNPQARQGSWAAFYRPQDKGGRGDCPFAASLVDAFKTAPADRRFKQSDEGSNAAGALSRFTLKFPDISTYKDNAPVIRVTEMYLNRAEALAEMNGVQQESLNLMNKLRLRAGLPVWTMASFAGKSAFIAAILNERRKELCFEGHRRMDLLRKGLSLRGNDATKVAGKDRVILPIPQREIDLSPALKGQQNPGY